MPLQNASLCSVAARQASERRRRYRAPVPYTDQDFADLVAALKRYADESMDQFDYLTWQSKFGAVFVSIRRATPEPGVPVAAFRAVD